MKIPTVNENLIKIILINLTIIILLPFNLILDDQSLELDLVAFQIFFSYLFFFLISSIISIFLFYGVNFITSKAGKSLNKYFLLLISFFFIWIIINGIFLPVVGEHDAFFNLNYSIRLRYLLLIKIIFTLIFLIFFEKSKYKKKILKFFSFYILLNIFYIMSSIALNNNLNQKNSDLNNFGKKNLIVLSLDGISGLKMNKEINLNNQFNKVLKDFKLYKNATSAWPATMYSLNTELNGKVLEMNEKNLKENILNDNSINTSTYGVYGRYVIDKKKIVNRLNYKNYGRSHDVNIFFQKYILASLGRWGTPYLVRFVKPIFYTKKYKQFIDLISLDFLNPNNLFNENLHTAYNIQSPEFDLIFRDTNLDSNLNETIRMYHFSFSHWPVKIDKNCKEVKKLNLDIILHEEIAVKCLAKKINLFLSELKKNNIYDNSLIIIKSDHGKPNGHYDEYPLNLTINKSIYWGVGRYKTFVMLKDMNERRNTIEISNKHIFLADLAITYCNFFYQIKKCNNKYNGNDLLSDENSFKKNEYEIYIPNKEYAFIDMNDFSKYKITNNKELEDSLKILDINLN